MNSSFKKLCNTLGVVTAAVGVLALGPAACSSDEKVSTGGPAGGTGGSGTGGSGGTAASGGSAGTAATGGSGATDSGAGTGGTSSGGTGGSGTTRPPECETLVGLEQCGSSAVTAEFRTPNMLVVIDKSGSMDDTFGTGTKKWDAMKQALDAVLNASATQISFGLELYPFSQDPSQPITLDCGDRCCEHASSPTAINVPIESGTTGVPKILSALNSTSPGGGTPTAAALQRAYDYFTSGAGASLQGDRYVLLATDGGPNCNAQLTCQPATCTSVMDGKCPDTQCCALNDPVAHQQCLDDAEVLKQITALKNAGIPTFVVGIPGTEAYRTYLNQFAVAGGVPATGGTDSYFAVDTSGGTEGLVEVFTEITRQLVRSCDIQLTANPPDPNQMNVVINCEVLPPSSPDGSSWSLNETTQPNTVVLAGPVCDWIQTVGAQRVDILYGCPKVPSVF
jgi:hypothetical protein